MEGQLFLEVTFRAVLVQQLSHCWISSLQWILRTFQTLEVTKNTLSFRWVKLPAWQVLVFRRSPASVGLLDTLEKFDFLNILERSGTKCLVSWLLHKYKIVCDSIEEYFDYGMSSSKYWPCGWSTKWPGNRKWSHSRQAVSASPL